MSKQYPCPPILKCKLGVAFSKPTEDYILLPKEFDVEGKTVIVTGAARGIGRGIAEVLVEAGAKVLVTSLTDRYLKPFSDEMAKAGHPIETLTADATTSKEWDRTIKFALSKFGHVDALINNLGDAIMRPIVPLPDHPSRERISDDEYRKVLDVNLTEAFMGCRAVGPHFIERRRGKVINISSSSARRGAPETLVYSTAKAALVRLTQTLALEWAPYGITVNCIAPGSFPDPTTTGYQGYNEAKSDAKKRVPLGSVGNIREVGFLALYMISAASNYMTGETVYIDGGSSFN